MARFSDIECTVTGFWKLISNYGIIVMDHFKPGE